mgnify:CR=1
HLKNLIFGLKKYKLKSGVRSSQTGDYLTIIIQRRDESTPLSAY